MIETNCKAFINLEMFRFSEIYLLIDYNYFYKYISRQITK